MPVSEAKKKANEKWNKAHPYARITLIMDAEQKQQIKAAAAQAGQSVNAYIIEAITEKMQKL